MERYLEITPDKSRIVRTKDTIKMVYINKKSNVKRREECNNCIYMSKVQLGLGWGMSYCCDQPNDGWKQFEGWATRKCKLFESKE